LKIFPNIRILSYLNLMSLTFNLKTNSGSKLPWLKVFKTLTIIICLFSSSFVFGQGGVDSVFSKWTRFSEKVGKTSEKIDQKLSKKTDRLLQQCEKQERKLYRKLLDTKDSAIARKRLSEIGKEYSSLKKGLKDSTSALTGPYIPSLDSLGIALQCKPGDLNNKLAQEKLRNLKQQFNQSDKIKRIIQERKQKLKELCGNSLPAKYWKQLNKQVYYYNQQLREYREMLNDPNKIIKKGLAVLKDNKMFQEFFRKNSQLASLFRLPSDPSQFQLQGLQTRVQTTQFIQQQIAGGGQAGLQQLQQNLSNAQAELNKLKDKVMKAGGSGSDQDLAEGFKPNSQRTKSFLKRLDWGVNWQSQKASNYFPVTADLGLSVGFKVNDHKVIGLGASYKMGLGRGWDHIKFSSQGLSLRSFIEWKLKSDFWLYGGYEMNYRSEINRIDQLKNLNEWVQSGLMGLTRSIPFKSKMFNKAKLMLLWDFMANKQIPKMQALVFRVSYNIK